MFRELFRPPEVECPSCGQSACFWDDNAPLHPGGVGLRRLLARLARRIVGVRLRCRHCRTRFADAVELPRVVVGYHGCRRDFAEALVAGRVRIDDWRPSRNDYDWLGEGIYFWECAPGRAWQWARQRYRREAAAVMAEIELGRCLNLADPDYAALLAGAYRTTVEWYAAEGEPLPVNSGRELKLRRLDRAVIDRLTKGTDRPEERYWQTVRGPFEEGEPLYAGGMIRRQSHVQIAVRDGSCIRTPLYLVRPRGEGHADQAGND